MVMWKIVFTKQAQKDAEKIARTGLKKKAETLLKIIEENPYQNPPAYEQLIGDLSGAYSRRINIQHRLIYQIYEEMETIKVIRMWTHYE
jgi:toxin YoeB